MKEKGLVYLFYGNGKGKTSAALGTAMRMVAIKKKVVWISWFKSLKWNISEANLIKSHKNLKMCWTGEGFYLKGKHETRKAGGAVIKDLANPKEHKEAAEKALGLAKKYLMDKGRPDLLVLDEILDAVTENLITEKQLINLLDKRKKTHIIVTGHMITDKIFDASDLITEMKNKRHPFEKGMLAARGLDF